MRGEEGATPLGKGSGHLAEENVCVGKEDLEVDVTRESGGKKGEGGRAGNGRVTG